MQGILTQNLEWVKDLCITHNIKSLFAFGSVCTHDFNSKSDIDFLVSFNTMDYADSADNYFLVAEKLESIFKRPIDLVTDKSLGNPFFIESLNKTKTLLYEQ